MLSKNQILNARRAVERLYTGSCTIIEYGAVMDEKTKVTHWEERVAVEGQPCRLSFEKVNVSAQSETASEAPQGIRLFLSPELAVKSGSKLVIAQDGATGVYSASGAPAVYSTHQEIVLELFREWS